VVHTVPVPRRPSLRLAAALAGVLVASLVAGACSSEDGRTLPPPSSGQATTAPTGAMIGTPSTGVGAQEVFSLFSDAIVEGGVIPVRFTCSGVDVSPPLHWTSPPPAAELALVVRDRDAAGFVHWVLARIDPTVLGLGEGGIPEGAVEATNDTGTVGWAGPCPPPGTGTHGYEFTLHVLAEPVTIEPGIPAGEAAALIEGASVEQATLTATATASG